jgi:FkbM family methyltransferase
MHLILPNGEIKSLDFEPLHSMAQEPQHHIQEIVDQLNSGGYRDMAMRARDTVVLDLGANVGLFTIYLASVAKEVFSVEPSPQTFAVLRQVVQECGPISLVPMAIAGHDGFTDFHQYNFNRTADSIYKIGVGEKLSVPCCTLATLIGSFHLREIGLIKMDIEGAEVDVLRDPRFPEVVTNVSAFYLECHNFKEWGDGNKLVQEMRGYLEQAYPHVQQTGTNNLYAWKD